MRPKLILTGANGFVGSRLLPRLIEQGFEVYALSRSQIHTQIDHCHWVVCDILDLKATAFELASLQATHLMHTAWITEHGVYWNSPLNKDWLLASQNLITSFAQAGGKYVLALGSCAEYDWLNHKEEAFSVTSPCQPATFYGQKKLEFCNWLLEYAEQVKIKALWARLFYLYGEGEPKNRLFPSLLNCALTGAPFLTSSLTLKRDYMSVEECAEKLTQAFVSQKQGVLNIGTGIGLSIEEIAKKIEHVTGKKIQLIEQKTQEKDVHIIANC